MTDTTTQLARPPGKDGDRPSVEISTEPRLDLGTGAFEITVGGNVSDTKTVVYTSPWAFAVHRD